MMSGQRKTTQQKAKLWPPSVNFKMGPCFVSIGTKKQNKKKLGRGAKAIIYGLNQSAMAKHFHRSYCFHYLPSFPAFFFANTVTFFCLFFRRERAVRCGTVLGSPSWTSGRGQRRLIKIDCTTATFKGQVFYYLCWSTLDYLITLNIKLTLKPLWSQLEHSKLWHNGSPLWKCLLLLF